MKKLDILVKKFRRINTSYFKTKEGNLYMFYHCSNCDTYHTYFFEKQPHQANPIIQDKMFYVERTLCKHHSEGEPYLLAATQPVIHSDNMITFIARKTNNYVPQEGPFIAKRTAEKYKPKALTLDSVKKTLREQELKEHIDKALGELLRLAEDIQRKLENNRGHTSFTANLMLTASYMGKLNTLLHLNDHDCSSGAEIVEFLTQETKELRLNLTAIAKDIRVNQNTTLSGSLEEKVQKMFRNLASDY